MKLKFTNRDYLMWVIMIIPFVVIFYYWKSIPTIVPVRFNSAGKPSGFGGKNSIFLMPAFSLLCYLLIIILPYIDPRKRNYDLFRDTLKNIQMLLVFFMSMLGIVITLMTIGKIEMGPALILNGVYFLILLMGNFMGKLRANFFIGIRTPWTLSDETVWIKTHRLAGKIWVYSSVVMILLSLLVQPNETVVICYTGVIAIVPVAYSFILYKRLHRKEV